MQQVIYYSRGGNTRRLAEAIADELDVRATDVEGTTLGDDRGVVFLGSGCYGGKPSPDVIKFVRSNDFQGRRVALFGTSWGGLGKELQDMAKELEERGASVQGRFFCKGQTFAFINRGRPDAEDLTRARAFAREAVGDA